MKRLHAMLLLFLLVIIMSACSKSISSGESETVKTSLVQREEVEFSQEEKDKLTELIGKLPVDIKQEYNTKYKAWKATWEALELSIHSDVSIYTKSQQYQELIEYCKNQGKAVWPLLFERFDQGNFLAKLPILELTMLDYEELLDEIREESTKEKYTAEGVYIAPSAESNITKYIKELLSKIDN